MFSWLKDIMFAGMPPPPVRKHCAFCKRELMTDDPTVVRNRIDDRTFYHPCPRRNMELVVLTTKGKRDAYDFMA